MSTSSCLEKSKSRAPSQLAIFLLAIGAVCLSVQSVAQEQAPAPNQPFEFPQFAEQWINSAPLNAESLRGKAVVMWFFEEDCPRCRDKWPEFLETARQYEGKPVMFVAVNSGSSRKEIEKYVRDQQIPWPVIVDFDRSFEKACGVNEISLRNIFQARALMPDGTLSAGGGLASSAERAAKEAAWKIDPTGLPDALRPAWIKIELGDYQGAANDLRRNTRGSKQVKAAAQKLRDEVSKIIDAEIATAEKNLADNEKWTALKQFHMIRARYQGFETPDSVKENLAKLNRDPDIQSEKKAQKRLAAARSAAQRGGPSTKRAVILLKRLVEDHPDSAAADEARKLISKAEASR